MKGFLLFPVVFVTLPALSQSAGTPESMTHYQMTTIKMDKNGGFTQYLMNSESPTILSTSPPHEGNKLLLVLGLKAFTISHYVFRVTLVPKSYSL